MQWLDAETLSERDHAHEKAVAGRPLMIFFAKEFDDPDEELLFNEALWQDEHVGIAARYFNCYRISLDDIESPTHRKKYDRGDPWILLLSPEGKTLKKLSGRSMSGRTLFSAMSQVVKSQWKLNLKSLLPKQAKILETLDELHIEIERLERTKVSTEEHLKEHDCTPGKKRLKETVAALEKARTKREETLAADAELFEIADEEEKAADAQ